jgi:hypothetical protein
MLVAERAPAAAFSTNPPPRQSRAVEIILAAVDRRARQPRDLRHQRQPTAPCRALFGRRKQPATAFVQFRAERLPPNPNRCRVNHDSDLQSKPAFGNPQPNQTDSLIDRKILSVPRILGMLRRLCDVGDLYAVASDMLLNQEFSKSLRYKGDPRRSQNTTSDPYKFPRIEYIGAVLQFTVTHAC